VVGCYFLYVFFLFSLRVLLFRDVEPSQSTDSALGAANSAPVPSADDIGMEDTDMQVDSTKVNGDATGTES
jgi:hypothetical protein